MLKYILDTNLDTEVKNAIKYTIIKQNKATKWQDFAFLLQQITIFCAPDESGTD